MALFRVLAGIAAGSVGCNRAPELQDSFRASDLRLPFDQRLRIEIAAPIIVFGRVLEFTDIGRPHSSPGDPRIKTQLTKLKIHVEEAIKAGSNPTRLSSTTSPIPRRTTGIWAYHDTFPTLVSVAFTS
jgi:hypothetical protein